MTNAGDVIINKLKMYKSVTGAKETDKKSTENQILSNLNSVY